MARPQLSLSLPPKVRTLLEKEAKRNRRSEAAVVRDALELYFRLRGIGIEDPTPAEKAAIAEGLRDVERGDVLSLDEWRHAVGLADR
jgi:predicted transcriptional regulator